MGGREVSSFRRPLTITRYPAGSYVNGVWTQGTPTSVSIRASVQPTSPHDLQRLPEGRRTGRTYTLFSNEQLFPAQQGTATNSDQVTLYGLTFEVISCEQWQNDVIPHYKSIVGEIA